jgi:hypothetical protein
MAAKKKKAQDTTAPVAPEPEHKVKIAKQEYRLAAIAELKVHPRNPKKGNVDAIGESMERNDFYGAAVVQKSTGFILAGNHRYKGAIEKGLTEIPIIEVDCDDATAERILLADNKIADLGSYDQAALLAIVEDRAKHGDLKGTGYVDMDLERMKAKLQAPERFPEFDGQVTVKYRCPKCGFSWS